jgi:hypothetical protein
MNIIYRQIEDGGELLLLLLLDSWLACHADQMRHLSHTPRLDDPRISSSIRHDTAGHRDGPNHSRRAASGSSRPSRAFSSTAGWHENRAYPHQYEPGKNIEKLVNPP